MEGGVKYFGERNGNVNTEEQTDSFCAVCLDEKVNEFKFSCFGCTKSICASCCLSITVLKDTFILYKCPYCRAQNKLVNDDVIQLLSSNTETETFRISDITKTNYREYIRRFNHAIDCEQFVVKVARNHETKSPWDNLYIENSETQLAI